MAAQYDQDFYTWTQEQAVLLKEGRFDLLDIPHLVEELDSMGKSQISEFASQLGIIIDHLLRLKVQTDRSEAHERSWRTTIRVQREDLADHLDENPGLRNPEIIARAMKKGWRQGLILAVRETGLDDRHFPTDCPFSFEDLTDPDFLPK
jgi:hypothetical protein